MRTVLLLTASNVFMTFAWYGHLKFKQSPLWIAILASWGIAFFEYCLQVPANRYGHAEFSAPQLKILQEAITLVVFGLFSVLFLRESPRWNDYLGFALILAAVFVVFVPGRPSGGHAPGSEEAPRATAVETTSANRSGTVDSPHDPAR